MNEVKRCNEPIFWALFGAGGMWGAIFAPAIIFVLLLLPGFGSNAGVNSNTVFYGSALGKLFMFCMIVLPLWCGMHRIHHCMHDMKIHSPLLKTACYGIAGFLSLVALFLVFAQ